MSHATVAAESPPSPAMRAPQPHNRPLALIVFLENVGHISGVTLPRWVMRLLDFVTEEYAKLLLRRYGAYRRYDEVIILEDERATGPDLVAAILRASRTHTVDLLLLVHGRPGSLVGHKGEVEVGSESFDQLLAAYAADPDLVHLRMVFGLNCYGASLAQTWLALGAQAVNGAAGVNWLPEPTLSVFLREWLRGASFSAAVQRSQAIALRWGRRIWPSPQGDNGEEHAKVAGSRMAIFGVRDITIAS